MKNTLSSSAVKADLLNGFDTSGVGTGKNYQLTRDEGKKVLFPLEIEYLTTLVVTIKNKLRYGLR